MWLIGVIVVRDVRWHGDDGELPKPGLDRVEIQSHGFLEPLKAFGRPAVPIVV
jgi:hypothetical protein